MTSHQPVMLAECLNYYDSSMREIYLDCTFGAGGHSAAILSAMHPDSRLYVIDQDPEAERRCQAGFADPRLTFARDNFAQVKKLCHDWEIDHQVDVALADLGVSSPQLDEVERGFSFRADAPLDMRMDPEHGLSALEWLQQVDVQQMRQVFKELGQISQPGRLANTIDRYRRKRAITSTQQLAELISAVVGRKKSGIHPATNAFRAIRMHINQELENLAKLLTAMNRVLQRGGRLLLICFHSLEIRLVRSYLRTDTPQGLPVKVEPPYRLLADHKPSATEVEHNPRARSARLFVLQNNQ